MLPWTDRTGRFSSLKCTAFIATLAPVTWIVIEATQGWLGPRPVMEAIHQSGLWAVRFLALTLAVTPFRYATHVSKLLSIRRILGLAVLAYATLHVALYVIDQKLALGHVAAEIVTRLYLTIGFVGFVGFCILGSTSTDRMIARLGVGRWSRLQQFVYPGAVIVSVHFFMQSKLDITQPTVMAGIFGLLLAFRVVHHRRRDLSAWDIGLLGAAAALATALGEAAWFSWSAGAPLLLVLGANLDFSFAVRPAWFVLGAASTLLAARLARPLLIGCPGDPKSRPRSSMMETDRDGQARRFTSTRNAAGRAPS